MNDNKKIMLLIGECGEQIVKENVKNSIRTSNWYDSEKDGIIDHIGKFRYEVKTQTINNRDNGFWLKKDQWNKVDGVDIFYIVRIPDVHESEGLILYQVLNHLTNYRVIRHKQQEIRVYPLSKCLPIRVIHDHRAKEVLELSKKIRTFKF
tara:strand:+ start:57 stop:506 length:450 start_codon:yes stop_codon:yes gene_type:complete